MNAPAAAAPQPRDAGWRLPLGLRLRRGKGRGKLYAGAVIVGTIAVLAIFSRQIAPHDPIAQDLTIAFQPPGQAHFLGTDQFGRDVWSRVLYAGSLDLQIAFLGTVF